MAIKHFESEAEIARICKITRQAVHKWPYIIPIKQAWKLERGSGGKLSMRLADYR